MVDIDAIKARRDWREGRDLSQMELRLDEEYLAKHYAEDVTALIEEVEQLRQVLVFADGFAATNGYHLAELHNETTPLQGVMQRAGCYPREGCEVRHCPLHGLGSGSTWPDGGTVESESERATGEAE